MSETPSTHEENTPEAEMATDENFAELLEESLQKQESFEGAVAKGRVVSIENDMVLVDVGLKSEGHVPLREFTSPGEDTDLKPGDEVDVFVERLENNNGEAMLSREKARREESWILLEKSFATPECSLDVGLGDAASFSILEVEGHVKPFAPWRLIDMHNRSCKVQRIGEGFHLPPEIDIPALSSEKRHSTAEEVKDFP